MSRIVVVWESGSDIASLHDVLLIGRAIAARGHQVSYVLGDPVTFEQLTAGQSKPVIYPAPTVPGVANLVMKPPKVGGFADHMALQGYDDAATLTTLAATWRRVLLAANPDAIVAVGAPVVWLAGPTVAKTIAVGDAWSLPPIVGDGFARTGPEIAPIVSPETLVENANHALVEIGGKTIETPADLLSRLDRMLYGASYFDPYLTKRRDRSAGLLGIAPNPRPPTAQPHLAIFLDVYCPNIEAIVVALAGLDGITASVHIRGATRAMRDFLSAQPNIEFHRDFIGALAGIERATAVVHHAQATISGHALALGRPQLVLPWMPSNFALQEGLKLLGVNWSKDPRSSIQELGGTMRAVVNDALILVRSQHYAREMQAQGIGDALPALVALAERTARTATAKAIGTATAELRPEIMPAAVSSVVTQPPPVVAPLTPVLANDQDAIAVSDSFCSLPFQHMCIGIEGTARMCCVTPDMVTDGGEAMSLYRHSVDDIWNSDYMREMRRKMLAGEPIDECQVCYANEAASAISYRTTTGLVPVPGQTIDRAEMQKAAIANDYRVKALPEFIKLELGNLCNLKCRMCYGGNSSEIERDPVHSRWSGGSDPMHAIWQGDQAFIGPDPRLGVSRQGIHTGEWHDGRWMHWTDGSASVDLPIGPRNRLTQLQIQFDEGGAGNRHCTIRVNGQTRFSGRIGRQAPPATIDLSGLDGLRSLRVEIQSELEPDGDRRRIGVPLGSIILRRSMADAAVPEAIEVVDPVLAKPGLWYRNDDLLFGQLMGDLANLKRLYVTGGEPLLEPRFMDILDHLISRDAAKHVHLELTTNLTVMNNDILERIAKFGSHEVTVSIDGVGAVQEYIRYPSRWPVIAENAKKLVATGFRVCTITVVQAYNMLGLADICRFGREIGLEVSLANVVRDPNWLRTSVMPASVNRLAGERLRGLATGEGNEWWRNHYLSLASHFESVDQPLDHAAMRQFMLFTNDLDASRGQSFKASLPELYGMIEEAGYQWTDETLHAAGAGQRRPARERVHAWV